MSTCISIHGEYSAHTLDDGDERFTCSRCGVFDEARIYEALEMALRMHEVQFERANRAEAELARIQSVLRGASVNRNGAR